MGSRWRVGCRGEDWGGFGHREKRRKRAKDFFWKVSKEREILSLFGLCSGFGLGGPRTEFLELGSWQDYPSWQGGRLVWLVEFSVTVKGACRLNTEGAWRDQWLKDNNKIYKYLHTISNCKSHKIFWTCLNFDCQIDCSK